MIGFGESMTIAALISLAFAILFVVAIHFYIIFKKIHKCKKNGK